MLKAACFQISVFICNRLFCFLNIVSFFILVLNNLKSETNLFYYIASLIYEMQMKSIHILERQQKNGQNFEGVTT